MSFDISRLQAQLNNTGLQNKNTPLYQFLNQLLNNLKNIDTSITNVVNNPTAPITNLTQILQSIALGDDNSNNDNNDLFVPGSQSGSAQNISILFSDRKLPSMCSFCPGVIVPIPTNPPLK